MRNSRATPEERLLKIIEKPEEGKKITQAFTRKQKQQAFIRQLQDIISLKWLDKEKLLNLHTFNIFLVVISVIATVLLVSGFISQKKALNNKYANLIKPLPQEECAQEETVETQVEVRSVIGEAKRRNVFTLTPEVKKEEAQKRQKPLTALKLVGILWSEDSPQAMIEDSEDKKTHILSIGDSIDRWKIKAITNNKVVLVDEEGEWDLK
jgi:Tfp pilus assembly protein PilP